MCAKSRLTALTALALNMRRHTDKDLSPLAEVRGLRQLDMRGEPLAARRRRKACSRRRGAAGRSACCLRSAACLTSLLPALCSLPDVYLCESLVRHDGARARCWARSCCSTPTGSSRSPPSSRHSLRPQPTAASRDTLPGTCGRATGVCTALCRCQERELCGRLAMPGQPCMHTCEMWHVCGWVVLQCCRLSCLHCVHKSMA
jgi:hypothetical protein